ncbi:hypothetical protein Anapl_17770 [Anas platyrhynchos]|uniref:Uncharacterized protein n=1 Tax=Anas platyrhynchos TaxID=8839 RepID=R0L1I9_ANAPL|nr:hypothetical protein Anapl_17770 [Anas platyrhynchos]
MDSGGSRTAVLAVTLLMQAGRLQWCRYQLYTGKTSPASLVLLRDGKPKEEGARAASGWEADGGGRKRGAGVLLCGLKALYPIGWSLPAAMGVDVQE